METTKSLIFKTVLPLPIYLFNFRSPSKGWLHLSLALKKFLVEAEFSHGDDGLIAAKDVTSSSRMLCQRSNCCRISCPNHSSFSTSDMNDLEHENKVMLDTVEAESQSVTPLHCPILQQLLCTFSGSVANLIFEL